MFHNFLDMKFVALQVKWLNKHLSKLWPFIAQV